MVVPPGRQLYGLPPIEFEIGFLPIRVVATVEIPFALDDAQNGQSLLFGIHGPFDAPIVRNVQLPPGRVVEIRPLAVGDLAQVEPPIAVEGDRYAVGGGAESGLAGGGYKSCQTVQSTDSQRIHRGPFQ